MFTKTILASALASFAATAPLTQRAEDTSFTLLSIHSGSDVQNQAIAANGQRFWIGKETSTYCPVGSSCPANTDVTALVSNGGSIGMDASVPGGQQVYVTADGQLGYTIAHSARIPGGASVTGFKYVPENESGAPGELIWNSYSFVACPNGDAGVYQIYAGNASIASSTDSTCIGIVAATVNNTAGAAWQYA